MNHKKYPIHVYIFIIIVIIVLIATIFSARKVGQKLNHAKIATTKVKIKILNSALEQFKNDHGYYPKDGLIALIKKPEHVRNSGKLPDDPWNNSFQYKLIFGFLAVMRYQSREFEPTLLPLSSNEVFL